MMQSCYLDCYYAVGSSSRSGYFYGEKVWRYLSINTQYASSKCWSLRIWGM